MITYEELKRELFYDPETGEFSWKRTKSGRKAYPGYWAADGYLMIYINGRHYQAHRLAWLYVHGSMPVALIDHRNRCKADNRISNLREADAFLNAQNRGLMATNSSGHPGVRFKKKRWEVSRMLNKKRVYLGRFNEFSAAVSAYENHSG